MPLTIPFAAAGLAVAFIAIPRDMRGRIRPAGWLAIAALSAGLAVLADRFAPGTAQSAHAAAVTPVLLALAAGDLATRRIANRAVAIAAAGAWPIAQWGPAGGYLPALYGALAGFGLGFLAYLGGRGTAFGAGDAKLAGLIGFVLGLSKTLVAL